MKKKEFKEGMKFKVNSTTSENGNIIEITGVTEHLSGTTVIYKTIESEKKHLPHRGSFVAGSVFSGYLTPLEENETIVIYRKDREVIALDKRTGKKAVAKCNPSDQFDFETGAKLAFERLFEKPERVYNGKICITEVTGKRVFSFEPQFKVGNIIEIKDGKFETKEGMFPMDYRLGCVEDINEYLSHAPGRHHHKFSSNIYKFVEVVE